ncbi:hypothetical protein LCGC14_0351160 [marine sediment metagenome]|uniref:Right handed beta helix domain-containing protein n=1 Tax=marine sediment metagenome TaxID=412755 RepID=A0A0F9TTG9_9ZZZZ
MTSMINDLNTMSPSAFKHKLGRLVTANQAFPAYTRGNTYFVDPEFGKDSYSGTDIKYAFQTIQKAVDKCSGESDDYIYLLPSDGVDYDDDTVGTSLANAYVYINKSNVHLIGLNPPHMQSVIIKPGAAATAGIIALGTGADRCEIAGITFDLTTAANECIDVPSGGANGVWVHDCHFIGTGDTNDTGINTANAANSSYWIIEDCVFYNLVIGAVKGYFNRGVIRNNRIVKTVTGALTDGISLLDNTTTADSDGCLVENNIVGGGIVGTTPLATGIKVASACYGVIISNNYIGGCTDNLSMTENTAAAHAFHNYTYDQGQGNVAYTTLDDKLPQ